MTFFEYSVYNIPEKQDIQPVPLEGNLNIIVRSQDYMEKEQILLSKILASVNQQVDDCKIHRVEKDIIQFEPLDKQHLCVVFGSDKMNLMIQIDKTPYQIKKIGGISFILSHSLDELPDNPNYRRALWVALKKYYNIS